MAGVRADQRVQKDEPINGEGLAVTKAGAPTGQATKTTAAGGIGTAAPAQTAPKTPKFINLQTYLTANPNAATTMAQRGVNLATESGTKYKTGAAEAGKTFGEEVAKDVTKVEPTIISGLEGGTAQTVPTVKRTVDDKEITDTATAYEGPTDITAMKPWQAVEKAGTQARGDVTTLTADDLSSATGLLLRGTSPTVAPSQAAKNLTGAMLATQRPMFSGLKGMLEGVEKDVTGVVEGAKTAVDTKKKEATQTGLDIVSAAKKGATKAQKDIEGGVGARMAPVIAAEVAKVKDEYRAATGQELTDEQAAALVTQGADPLAGMTQEQLANINALRAMAGMTPLLEGAELPGYGVGRDAAGFQALIDEFNRVQGLKQEFKDDVARVMAKPGVQAAAPGVADDSTKQLLKDMAITGGTPTSVSDLLPTNMPITQTKAAVRAAMATPDVAKKEISAEKTKEGFKKLGKSLSTKWG